MACVYRRLRPANLCLPLPGCHSAVVQRRHGALQGVLNPVGFLRPPDDVMPARPSPRTWLHAAAAAAVSAGTLAGLPHLLGPGEGADTHSLRDAIAAAAWAQSHCDTGLTLNERATTIDRDALLERAAVFETERERRGTAVACTSALQAAQHAIEPRFMWQARDWIASRDVAANASSSAATVSK